MTITEIKDQVGSAGSFCVQDQSIANIGSLDVESTNAFTYSGAGSPACVNDHRYIESVISIGSSTILVCLAGGVTPGGGAGWGSATVHTNCTSCATILSLDLTGFTAIRQGSCCVNLQCGYRARTHRETKSSISKDRPMERISRHSALCRPYQVRMTIASPTLLCPQWISITGSGWSIRRVSALIRRSPSSVRMPEKCLRIYPNPVGGRQDDQPGHSLPDGRYSKNIFTGYSRANTTRSDGAAGKRFQQHQLGDPRRYPRHLYSPHTTSFGRRSF